MTSKNDRREGADDDTKKVPVVEERATVSKKEAVTGGKRISTDMETVEEEAALSLTRQQAVIDRVPVNEVVTERPEPRREGAYVIVPITEERLVTTKQLVVTEEIRVRIDETTEEERRKVPLVKERVRIDEIPSSREQEGQAPSRARSGDTPDNPIQKR